MVPGWATIDLTAARSMPNVVVVREDDFVGFAAPTLFQASAALEAVAPTAAWITVDHPSSNTLHADLKAHARIDAARPHDAGIT